MEYTNVIKSDWKRILLLFVFKMRDTLWHAHMTLGELLHGKRNRLFRRERRNNYRNSLDVPFFSIQPSFTRADQFFSLQFIPLQSVVISFSLLPGLLSIIYTMSTSFPKKVMHESIICRYIKYFHIGFGIFLLSRLTGVLSKSI